MTLSAARALTKDRARNRSPMSISPTAILAVSRFDCARIMMIGALWNTNRPEECAVHTLVLRE
jgi:hypothetical protein